MPPYMQASCRCLKTFKCPQEQVHGYGRGADVLRGLCPQLRFQLAVPNPRTTINSHSAECNLDALHDLAHWHVLYYTALVSYFVACDYAL